MPPKVVDIDDVILFVCGMLWVINPYTFIFDLAGRAVRAVAAGVKDAVRLCFTGNNGNRRGGRSATKPRRGE